MLIILRLNNKNVCNGTDMLPVTNHLYINICPNVFLFTETQFSFKFKPGTSYSSLFISLKVILYSYLILKKMDERIADS